MELMKKILLSGLILIVFYYVFEFYFIFKLIGLLIEAFIPILIGFFIALLLEPMILNLVRYNVKRSFAAAYVYFMCMVVFIIALRFLIPSIVHQVGDFIEQLPYLVERINTIVGKDLGEFFGYLNVEDLIAKVSDGSMKLINKVANIFTVLSLGLGASIYISIDFNQLKKNIVRLYPKKHFIKIWNISKKLTIVTFEYIKGLLWDSLFLYVLSLVILILIKFEYPYVYALIITITNLIPYIGPWIGGIIVGLVGFSSSFNLGVTSLVVVVFCQYIESTFVQPMILKNKTDLNPILSVLGVSFFGSLFGIMGMIISRLILIYLKIIYEDLLKDKLYHLILEKPKEIGYNLKEIIDKDK